MPYAEQQGTLRTPFSGKTAISRQNSFRAAIIAGESLQVKRAKYLTWLIRVGEATDQGAVEHFGWPLQSICSIRNSLVDVGTVKALSWCQGRYGKRVTVWAPDGWAAKLRKARRARKGSR